MNKRIRELAAMAGMSHDQFGLFFADYNHSEGVELEKFAELIIRECALAIDNVYANAKPDHGCYDWATFAESSDILDHFEMK